MSEGVMIAEVPTAYDYSSHVTLECPKCGRRGSFPHSRTHENAVEYAGVCDAGFDAGWGCGTVLAVQVKTNVLSA